MPYYPPASGPAVVFTASPITGDGSSTTPIDINESALAVPKENVTGLVADLAARPSGSGTANKVVKFSSASLIADGWASDDGVTWGVASKFTITQANGNFRSFGTATIDGAITGASYSGGAISGTFGVFTQNLSVSQDTALGDDTTFDKTTIKGNVTITSTRVAQADALLATYSGTAQGIDHTALYGLNSGTYDNTAGAHIASGVIGNSTATRSAGAFNHENRGVTGIAQGGQINTGVYASGTQFSFFGAAGSLYQSAIAQFDSGIVLGGTSGPFIKSGAGSPETVVTAPIGSMFLRTDGGLLSTLYVKESGSGNTGWAAK